MCSVLFVLSVIDNVVLLVDGCVLNGRLCVKLCIGRL